MDDTPLKSFRAAVLRWMSALERAEGGYTLRGGTGWAHPDDVARALGGLAKEALSRLAHDRQLDRENIALPGRGKPIWLHRINARGAATLAAAPPRALTGRSVERPVAILSESQTAALEAMRAARHDATRLRFTPPEPGWRTVPEIRSAPTMRPRRAVVHAADVDILQRWGLLEKRDQSHAFRKRRTVYRVTPIGEAVERLVWRDPEHHPAAAPSTKFSPTCSDPR